MLLAPGGSVKYLVEGKTGFRSSESEISNLTSRPFSPDVDKAALASPNPGGPLVPEIWGRFSMAPSGMLMGRERPNPMPMGLPKDAEKEELAELGSSLGS